MFFQTVVLPILIIAGVALFFALVLVFANKFLAIRGSENTEKVVKALPGANCGACGFAGCEQYAIAVAEKGAPCNLCVVGGNAVAADIAAIMGSAFEKSEERKAFIACNGSCSHVKNVSVYKGIDSCAACADMFLGRKDCKYGCLGLGDCVRSCPFGAIRIVDGIALIDRITCTGCGTCIGKCPKNLIKIAGAEVRTFVACSNQDKGNLTRKMCTSGCIGCKRCEKACAYDAVHVENFCASIDRTKCMQCHACRNACPTGAIVVVEKCGTIVGNKPD